MKPLFTDLSLTISSGDRIGVMGINGSGKSTLLRVIAGEQEPETGQVRSKQGLKVATLWQRPDLGHGTVRDSVGHNWQAAAAMDRLGLSEFADSPVDRLSGGQAKRAALAKALLDEDADLLVLDEPTNHLDLPGIEWLERRLQQFRGAVVMVSHDRHVLDAVTTRLVGIERGDVHIVDGGYQTYLEARAEQTEHAAKVEASRRILARKELAWLQRGARARRRKPKARIDIAQSTIQHDVEIDTRALGLDLGEFGSDRLGRRVVDLHGVAVSHGNGPSLFSDLDLHLASDARLGIVGPNGAGKTSLLDVIAGVRQPSAGTVEFGSTVSIGYFDQTGRQLDQALTVEEVVAGVGNKLERSQIALLERFWFEPDSHRALVSTLSGGEQRRLQLLVLLVQRPNLLLLDEPTNDLDLDTLRALEDWLDTWAGALVAVSHDRSFLERTIDQVIAVVDGEVTPIQGDATVWQQAVRPAKAVAGERSKEPKAIAGRVKRRSPSTLRRLIADAEAEIAELEDKRDHCVSGLASTTDHVELVRLGTELTEVEIELEGAEERWLELSGEAEDHA